MTTGLRVCVQMTVGDLSSKGISCHKSANRNGLYQHFGDTYKTAKADSGIKISTYRRGHITCEYLFVFSSSPNREEFFLQSM